MTGDCPIRPMDANDQSLLAVTLRSLFVKAQRVYEESLYRKFGFRVAYRRHLAGNVRGARGGKEPARRRRY